MMHVPAQHDRRNGTNNVQPGGLRAADPKPKTYLIVPAWSDQAGQCRIVVRNGLPADALADYRATPDYWIDVGLMNSRGELVYLDAPKSVVQEFRDCALMAGLQIRSGI
jgi:hypothetical protein